MADSEMKAVVIVLDDGNLLQVQSTVAEISAEIETRKNLNLPLIPVVGLRGREVWLNANHIVSFYASEPASP